MSRFKPSLLRPASPTPPYPAAPAVAGRASSLAAPEIVTPPIPPTSIVRSGAIDTLGYVLVCTYLVSGFINEWTIRLLGNKAYISQVLLLLLPVVLLLSSNRLRGLKHVTGIWWAAFLFFLLLAAPFSVWRTGTADLLVNYVSRSYSIYFLITAFTITLNRCRGLMFVNIASAVILLFNCLTIGVSSEDGRLRLAQSLFFSNSNDLALQLLIGIVQFVYLFREKGLFKKVFATGCIVLSAVYMLRTGSRGCVLSALCYGAFAFFFSRNKIPVLVLTLVVGVIGLATVPSMPLRRLTSFGVDEEASAAGSSMERRELLRRSIVETFKHPLVGVGPGQFAVYVFGEEQKKGQWSSWVGTHNSYTQVSAECGIPAFLCYFAIIALCFRLNYRVFRSTRSNPEHQGTAALSFTLLGSTIVYSVSTFFFHMAYSGVLPELSALTVAVYLAAQPTMELAAKPKLVAEPPDS